MGCLGGASAEHKLASMWAPDRKCTFSTSFSGIGAPEQAVHHLQCYLRSKLPSSPTSVKCIGAVEWNSFSRAELIAGPHPPSHLWVNIIEFVSPAIRAGVQAKLDADQFTFNQLWHQLSQPSAIRTSAHCVLCAGDCHVSAAQLHIAGTPCVDFSTQPGAKRLGTMGGACLPFVVWLALRARVQESIIVHENVRGFNPQTLVAVLGAWYVCMSVLLELNCHGFPVRRTRRLTLLVHRRLLRTAIAPIIRWSGAWVEQFKRSCLISFHKFLLATTAEIDSELQWVSTRSHRGGPPPVSSLPQFKSNSDVCASKFVASLNVSELLRLRLYRRKWPSLLSFPRVFMLNQEAATCPCVSGTRTMHTQTKSQDLALIDSLNRFIVPNEYLLMQGFPVYPCTKLHSELCAFDQALATRDARHTIEQSGNSMPVPLMSLTVLYAFLIVLDPSNYAATDALPPSVRTSVVATVDTDRLFRTELRAALAPPAKRRRLS